MKKLCYEEPIIETINLIPGDIITSSVDEKETEKDTKTRGRLTGINPITGEINIPG